jgi:hypothetical protein
MVNFYNYFTADRHMVSTGIFRKSRHTHENIFLIEFRIGNFLLGHDDPRYTAFADKVTHL